MERSAERMQARREHRVPPCRAGAWKSCPQRKGGQDSGFVFPAGQLDGAGLRPHGILEVRRPFCICKRPSLDATSSLIYGFDDLKRARSLRLGHCGDCRGDGVYHLLNAIRGCCPGAASEGLRRGVRLELRSDQPCVQPPVGSPGAGEPLCGMAWGPVRSSPTPVAWIPSIHCRHDVDRHHEQPVAILPLLRRGSRRLYRPFHRAGGVRRHLVGSGITWEPPWGSYGRSRELAQLRSFS